jgi:hypothetical protein
LDARGNHRLRTLDASLLALLARDQQSEDLIGVRPSLSQ